MKNLELLKPLLRFDCFFATLALSFMFGFFFYVIHTVINPGIELGKEAYLVIGTVIGAVSTNFEKLCTWAWRTSKGATDKRKEEQECTDNVPV